MISFRNIQPHRSSMVKGNSYFNQQIFEKYGVVRSNYLGQLALVFKEEAQDELEQHHVHLNQFFIQLRWQIQGLEQQFLKRIWKQYAISPLKTLRFGPEQQQGSLARYFTNQQQVQLASYTTLQQQQQVTSIFLTQQGRQSQTAHFEQLSEQVRRLETSFSPVSKHNQYLRQRLVRQAAQNARFFVNHQQAKLARYVANHQQAKLVRYEANQQQVQLARQLPMQQQVQLVHYTTLQQRQQQVWSTFLAQRGVQSQTAHFEQLSEQVRRLETSFSPVSEYNQYLRQRLVQPAAQNTRFFVNHQQAKLARYVANQQLVQSARLFAQQQQVWTRLFQAQQSSAPARYRFGLLNQSAGVRRHAGDIRIFQKQSFSSWSVAERTLAWRQRDSLGQLLVEAKRTLKLFVYGGFPKDMLPFVNSPKNLLMHSVYHTPEAQAVIRKQVLVLVERIISRQHSEETRRWREQPRALQPIGQLALQLRPVREQQSKPQPVHGQWLELTLWGQQSLVNRQQLPGSKLFINQLLPFSELFRSAQQASQAQQLGLSQWPPLNQQLGYLQPAPLSQQVKLIQRSAFTQLFKLTEHSQLDKQLLQRVLVEQTQAGQLREVKVHKPMWHQRKLEEHRSTWHQKELRLHSPTRRHLESEWQSLVWQHRESWRITPLWLQRLMVQERFQWRDIPPWKTSTSKVLVSSFGHRNTYQHKTYQQQPAQQYKNIHQHKLAQRQESTYLHYQMTQQLLIKSLRQGVLRVQSMLRAIQLGLKVREISTNLSGMNLHFSVVSPNLPTIKRFALEGLLNQREGLPVHQRSRPRQLLPLSSFQTMWRELLKRFEVGNRTDYFPDSEAAPHLSISVLNKRQATSLSQLRSPIWLLHSLLTQERSRQQPLNLGVEQLRNRELTTQVRTFAPNDRQTRMDFYRPKKEVPSTAETVETLAQQAEEISLEGEKPDLIQELIASPELDKIVDKVYAEIERRLRFERQRMGY